MEELSKGAIGSMAEEAAKLYRNRLNSMSGLNESKYFDKAEDCFRSGYERALLDICGESKKVFIQQVIEQPIKS